MTVEDKAKQIAIQVTQHMDKLKAYDVATAVAALAFVVAQEITRIDERIDAVNRYLRKHVG